MAMKNACVISDGGKILPKCSSNTFYHVNNNANHRQQQHQQSYIKHAPLRNSPPSNKTKYSIHGNISDNNSDEDNSRFSSSVQYYNSANNIHKNDSLESNSLDSNGDTGFIECHLSTKRNLQCHANSKTIRKRGISWDNSTKFPDRKSSSQVDKKRSSSVGFFCDPSCTENIKQRDQRKETGYVTILKINDSSEINVQKNGVKISSTKAGEYSSRRAIEPTTANNSSSSVKTTVREEGNIHRANKQNHDSPRGVLSTNLRESQPKLVKNDGSVVVQVRDPSVSKTRRTLTSEREYRTSVSNTYDCSTQPNTYQATTTEDLRALHKSSKSKTYNCNPKVTDSSRDLKRAQSNISKATKSSSLKRHSSACSGDLESNPGRNNTHTFSKDRRSSVDKAIQCRASSSSSLRFRSLVSF